MQTDYIEIKYHAVGSYYTPSQVLGSPESDFSNIEVRVEFWLGHQKYPNTSKWIPLELFLTVTESVNSYVGSIKSARYTDEHGERHEARFAKTWQVWDEECCTWRIVRIGIGAYGDYVIWRRPVLRRENIFA